MENSLVSILIPMYNSENYIEKTIQKLEKQTYKNIEIIIVDDHSTDNSFYVAQKHASKNVHVYLNPQKGSNFARNYAYKQSKGEYIKFLDADDECSDGMIEKQLKCLQNHGTNNSVVFSTLKIIYDDGRKDNFIRLIDKDYIPAIELLIDMWKHHQWNCPHCHLMHRSLFEKTSGWNESLLKNQDGEFFARIYSIADKAIFEPTEYAIWNRKNTGTISNNHSEKAELSVVESYKIIAKLILNYCDNLNNRTICAKHIGILLYVLYPQKKIASQRIIETLNQLNLPILLPTRNITKFIEYLFGWKFSVRFQKLFRFLIKQN